MTHQSRPDLLILHAVRLLGFANSAAIAKRAETSRDLAVHVLSESECAGWIQHVAFADLEGWSLTELGKAENERQLAIERDTADPNGVVPAVYGDFLPLNARLLRAVTDWQLKPTQAHQLVSNDHTDSAWDERILDEMAALGMELAPLAARLSAVLERFDGYTTRYQAALRKAGNGEHDWIDKTDVDSCHRVWFQLHEDLIATLGIDRRSEDSDGWRAQRGKQAQGTDDQ